MKKRLLVAALSLISMGQMTAQNPLINTQFAADPTARVFGDRVYVYPSHDIPPVKIPSQRPDWFCMGDYHAYSSSVNSLTDWTDHGVILDQKDVPWGDSIAYSMWAPDCVQGKDGRYYFFFPDAPRPQEGQRRGGFGVGVAISDVPYGPFKAEPKPIEGVRGIDPCVLQASDGNNYIYWAGGAIFQGKLKDNLLELDGQGTRVEGLPKGFVEGPFVFERNGIFYLTYPWVRQDGGTETLAYATSSSPLGPWEFRGVIMEESPTKCWTNHHSILPIKDQWYIFYHHNDYSPKFDKNRSMCCDSLSFNPDGTIIPVKPTRRGVGITDGNGRIQMDRYNYGSAKGVSIAYNDTLQPKRGWKLCLEPKAWATYGNVSISDMAAIKTAWICLANGELTTPSKSKLDITAKRLPNGLYEVTLTNKSKKVQEVDWISLSQRRPLIPFTQGGMQTGKYRNLFLEAGYSQKEIDKKLQSVFNDVFVGPNKCYFEVGDTLGYVSDVKNDDVRSEGMSYGMMLAVQWNRQDIFDRLWRWAKRYMLMTEGQMAGYFRWSCKRDGKANSQGPASDGELYFITSLIFASNQWGNNGGINYLADAQAILNAIQPKEIEQEMWWGPNRQRLETPVKVKRTISLIDPKTDLITFVPGANYTDPSYHLPAFYEVWARYAQDGRSDYWKKCAEKSREYLHKSIHPMTGLNADYNNYDGTLMNSRGIIGDAFRYDSWRVPMNIALDYSWSCADIDWQQNYAHTIQNFLYAQGVDKFVDQFNIDGTTPSRILRAGHFPEKLRHSIGFVATSAAASLMCTHPKSYEFIDQFWNAEHKPDADGFFDCYYDGLLRLFAFMHLSGNYRVIEPKK